MQTFEPFVGGPPTVRRASWINLHRSQLLDTNLQNRFLTEEKKTPNSLKEPFNFIHVFTLLLCITRKFKCGICQQLLMDVTVLDCGHAFCKFCLRNWLQTKEHCPVCLKTEVHPVCNRCYNLDSLVASFYQQLVEILDPNKNVILPSSSSSQQEEEQEIRHHHNNVADNNDIMPQLSNRLLKTRPIVVDYIRGMQNIRNERRHAMVGASCIIKAWSCPNRSMLQGVTDLGFGLRNSMEGFLLLVIGSFFLATAVCQFSDVMENLELLAIRRICYVITIMYLICSQHIPLFRLSVGAQDDATRQIFWDQIIKTKVTEQLDKLFPNEKTRMMMLIKKKQIDLTIVQLEVMNIIEKLAVLPERS